MPSSSSSSLVLATLVARRVSKQYGSTPVLHEVDLSVGPHQRIGILGPNGAGKTTLLRLLAGLEQPDEGSIVLTPVTATVGYLAQEHERSEHETVRQMLARRTGVVEAEEQMVRAAEALAGGSATAEAHYATALDRYLSLGAGDFDGRLDEVAAELDLPEAVLGRPTTALSGGQRAKASLAALLVSRFDLLLLDEPTNDLDFEGLSRLEAFLSERSGGIVVVSHDRSFLARTVDAVLELDEWSHRGTLYAGGFEAYLEARQVSRRHAEEAYGAYVTERERLRRREREQRQWAVQGVRRETKRPRDNDKAQRDFRINRTEKQASKVRMTEKALDRLEVVERPYQPWQLQLELAATERSGEVVAEIEGGVCKRGDFQLGPLDLRLSYGERLVLLGPNGSGKSTLLACLLGRLELSEGRARLGASVVVGELGQDRRRFADDRRLLEVFLGASGLVISEGRSLLAKFGLTARDVERSAGSLSPGERTRAEIALLVARGTNCLVLDEPTNHLDLPAIEQLEVALSSWPSTLLLVTHDQALLDAVELSRAVRLEHGQVISDDPL